MSLYVRLKHTRLKWNNRCQDKFIFCELSSYKWTLYDLIIFINFSWLLNIKQSLSMVVTGNVIDVESETSWWRPSWHPCCRESFLLLRKAMMLEVIDNKVNVDVARLEEIIFINEVLVYLLTLNEASFFSSTVKDQRNMMAPRTIDQVTFTVTSVFNKDSLQFDKRQFTFKDDWKKLI